MLATSLLKRCSRISFQGFLFKDACNITVPGNMTEMMQCETDVKAFGGEHSNHQHDDDHDHDDADDQVNSTNAKS